MKHLLLILLAAVLTAPAPGAKDGRPGEKLADIVARLGTAKFPERRQARLDLIRLARETGGAALRDPLREISARSEGHVKIALVNQLAWLDTPELAPWWNLLLLFDALEMPPVAGRRFVLMNTGRYALYGLGTEDETLRFEFVWGWVLEEGEDEITLLTTNLDRETHSRRVDPDPSWEKHLPNQPKDLLLPGKTRELEFGDLCGKIVDAEVQDYFGDFMRLSTGGQEHPTETALFAYWAHQRGDAASAKALFELAQRSADYFAKHRGGGKDATLTSQVRDAISTNLRWRAITAANRGAERSLLLEGWERLRRLLAAGEDSEAGEMVASYRSLIEEDAVWKEPSKDALATMAPVDRARYWFHHLRDHASTQCMQPGSVQILDERWWSDEPEEERKAGHAGWQLASLGPDAVPLLIEHLGDRRPTRSMGFWRHYSLGSFYLLRHSDACQEILREIAGRSFGGESPEEIRTQVLSWWREYREKGEERLLSDAVAAAGDDSPWQASKLLEKYPEAALDALARGIRAAEDRSVRGALVKVLGRIDGEGSRTLLVEEMRKGPALHARVTAAEILLGRGEPGALDCLIREWKGTAGRSRDECGGIWMLIWVLATCEKAEAIRALGRDWYTRPVRTRFDIVERFYSGPPLQGETRPSSEALQAVEDLLVAALRDEAPKLGCSYTWQDVHFDSPRICDIAGHILQVHFDRKFDIEAGLIERNRSRRRIQSEWRRSRGLPPEPRPAASERPAADPRARALLAELASTEDQEVRSRMIARLEELGLGALPAVSSSRAAAGDAQRARALAKLEKRLSLVVRVVRRVPGSFDAHPELQVSVHALKGKPLGPEALLRILDSWRELAGVADQQLRISALRVGDGSGVVIRYSIDAADDDDVAPEPGMYAYKKHVSVDGKELCGGGAGGPIDPRRTGCPITFRTSHFATCVRRAFDAGPDQEFRIAIILRVRRE